MNRPWTAWRAKSPPSTRCRNRSRALVETNLAKSPRRSGKITEDDEQEEAA